MFLSILNSIFIGLFDLCIVGKLLELNFSLYGGSFVGLQVVGEL